MVHKHRVVILVFARKRIPGKFIKGDRVGKLKTGSYIKPTQFHRAAVHAGALRRGSQAPSTGRRQQQTACGAVIDLNSIVATSVTRKP